METASARALHDRAQGVAASLQLLPPEAPPTAAAPLLIELAQLTAALRDAAAALADGSSRSIWEQRASWLRDETAKFGAARDGAGALLTEVLDACALQCRAARSAAEAAARAAEHVPSPPPPVVAAPSPRGALAVLQVRTELTLAQEQLARRTADRCAFAALAFLGRADTCCTASSQLAADVAALSEARAAAAAQAEQLSSELSAARDAATRQTEVIAELMRRSEELCADAGRVRELESENGALRRGLGQQAGTLERLIALNEELAVAANAHSAAREAAIAMQLGSAPAEAAHAAPPVPLYDEEWELEEAEARARGDPPPRGWLARLWGAPASAQTPNGAIDDTKAAAADGAV